MKSTQLPKAIARKLRSIRRRHLAFGFLEGLTLSLTVLLTAILAAMIVDWAIGWFDLTPRYFFTFLALGAGAFAFGLWCIRPLARKRDIASTALDVDHQVPQLEERWSTAIELAQNTDAPEVRGSERMIQKVTEEAESAGAAILPENLVSPKPVWRASRWLAAAAALFALFFVINFTQAKLLLQRFCQPGASISLTQVTSPTDTWVAKGEPYTITAHLTGRLPKAAPKLFLQTEAGKTERTMTLATGATNQFQHVIEEVSDSFRYRVRCGDGQTPWHRVRAVDRPKITEIKLAVAPPAYSKLPREEKSALPQAVRVLEGSEVEVSFRSDQPLDRMLLELGDGKSTQLSRDGDWYRFRDRPTNSFAFTASAINTYQLENRVKPSSRISLYTDLPPSVKVLDPSDDIAVRPDDKVTVTFEAQDDLGLAKAEVLITTLTAGGATNGLTLEVPLGEAQGQKHFHGTVELDPKALGLKHGDQLSYIVQVTDTKQTLARSAGEAAEETQDTAQASLNRDSTEGQPERAGSPGPSPLASQTPPPESSSNEAPLEGKTPPRDASSEARVNTSSAPPPNDMAKRTLDAGQCSACNPRNIKVDEWAGHFDGEKREKLELAIEPVLKQLDELLKQAQEGTDALKAPAASAAGLQPPHAEALARAQDRLSQSGKAIAALNARSSGTPYAFIGLQLQNIDQAHITPAHAILNQVTIAQPPATNNPAFLDQGAFHIARAREMLADLTQTYQRVKRDQQIADAMQELKKMYQVFLEDTQALLGSSKPPLNSYQRKIAEVDEAYVEKLKQLLEEKKKIMAELAKVLAEDPRMLRRYLAMLEQQGTSYRDQLTLLAQRQEKTFQQLAQWNAASETNLPALLNQFQASQNEDNRQLADQAVKLHENMETWVPLDVPVNQIQPVLARVENVVRFAGEKETNSEDQVLGELRALRQELPGLADLPTTNGNRMASFIANRLTEVETLITLRSEQSRINDALAKGDFQKATEVVQYRLTGDTIALGEKLDATVRQVISMSDEISEKAKLLNKTVQSDIIPSQESSVAQLSAGDMPAAERLLAPAPPAFALAERTFDELIQLIIAEMDKAPPPTDPGGASGLESLLALLQDEMKAAEGLGIPCRPINVSISKDWMKPGSNPGQGLGQAQLQAAQADAQHAHDEAEQLEKRARQSAQRALAQAQPPAETTERIPGAAQDRGEAWNKLVSKLQKDLLQGRDNTPPEQYRAAIENYFKTISSPNP